MKIVIDIGGDYKIPPKTCPACGKGVREIMDTGLPFDDWFIDYEKMVKSLNDDSADKDHGSIEITYECGAAVRKGWSNLEREWACSDWESYTVCRNPQKEIIEKIIQSGQ